MRIRIWKKDTITCEDCVIKHVCANSRCREPEGKKINPCDLCTSRCDYYLRKEREEQFGCSSRTCLFELDVEKEVD